MPRTVVQPSDLVALIVTALNNQTVSGGTIKAVVNGNGVKVTTHTDSGGGVASTSSYEVFVH